MMTVSYYYPSIWVINMSSSLLSCCIGMHNYVYYDMDIEKHKAASQRNLSNNEIWLKFKKKTMICVQR